MPFTVSIDEDYQYRDALALLARQQQRSVTALVTEAVNAMYGADIRERVSLFAPDVTSNPNIKKKQLGATRRVSALKVEANTP